VWADRVGNEWEIVHTDRHGIYKIQAAKVHSFYPTSIQVTPEGRAFTSHEDIRDLVTLIKDKEETKLETVRETKFKVGDIVRRRASSEVGVVEHIRLGYEYAYIYIVMWDTLERGIYAEKEIELVLIKEETVSKLDEVPVRNAVTNLPPEPIPGQYYRARQGFKIFFIGKGQDYYYYETLAENCIYCFSNAYQYTKDGGSHPWDIIAPWTEPLPAMEIKRWGLVVSATNPRLSKVLAQTRGDILEVFESKEKAETELLEYATPEDIEIVELVGTLTPKEN
jgi:hypothetical protein